MPRQKREGGQLKAGNRKKKRRVKKADDEKFADLSEPGNRKRQQHVKKEVGSGKFVDLFTRIDFLSRLIECLTFREVLTRLIPLSRAIQEAVREAEGELSPSGLLMLGHDRREISPMLYLRAKMGYPSLVPRKLLYPSAPNGPKRFLRTPYLLGHRELIVTFYDDHVDEAVLGNFVDKDAKISTVEKLDVFGEFRPPPGLEFPRLRSIRAPCSVPYSICEILRTAPGVETLDVTASWEHLPLILNSLAEMKCRETLRVLKADLFCTNSSAQDFKTFEKTKFPRLEVLELSGGVPMPLLSGALVSLRVMVTNEGLRLGENKAVDVETLTVDFSGGHSFLHLLELDKVPLRAKRVCLLSRSWREYPNDCLEVYDNDPSPDGVARAYKKLLRIANGEDGNDSGDGI